MTDPAGAAIYGKTWIPSIYLLYVSINIPAPWILWVGKWGIKMVSSWIIFYWILIDVIGFIPSLYWITASLKPGRFYCMWMLGAYMGVTNCEMGLIWRIHVMIREPDTFGHVGIIRPIGIYPLVNVYSFANWKITIFKFGKSTISMAMFNSYVTNYHRVPSGNLT